MKKKPERDSIYGQPQSKITDFVFDEKVANVFEDMLNRSIPGYADIEKMIGVLAREYVKGNSNCYDLGCSLGAATLSMLGTLNKSNCKIVAVDNSEAMVKKCRETILKVGAGTQTEVICQDVCDTKIENASFVVMNFTLQFVPLEKRLGIMKKIYEGLLPEGVFIFSEKIAFSDDKENAFQIELHDGFRKLNGYSDLEISQKRTALENILIPETLSKHQERVREAGFKNSFVWFQCFNFVSIIAFK